MSVRGSRWSASAVTFGPTTRIALTIVLIGLPVPMIHFMGLYGMVFTVIWVGWILPTALRDLWQPARLPSTDLTELAKQSALEAERARAEPRGHLSLDPDYKPPQRW